MPVCLWCIFVDLKLDILKMLRIDTSRLESWRLRAVHHLDDKVAPLYHSCHHGQSTRPHLVELGILAVQVQALQMIGAQIVLMPVGKGLSVPEQLSNMLRRHVVLFLTWTALIDCVDKELPLFRNQYTLLKHRKNGRV